MSWNDLHRAKQLLDSLLHLRTEGSADTDLRSLREAVTKAREQARTPAQMAAVMHLEDVLNWEESSVCLFSLGKNEISVRLEEVKQQLAGKPALRDKLSMLHHAWLNSAILDHKQGGQISSWLELDALPPLPPGLVWPDAETLDALFPGVRTGESQPRQDLQNYVERHLQALRELEERLAAELYRVVNLTTPRRAVRKVQHILVVEDHSGWRAEVTKVANQAIFDLGPIAVTAVGDCAAARAFAEAHTKEGILAICDLGLPAQPGGDPHESHGLALIEDLSGPSQCRILALTSHSQLDLYFVRLGRHLQDFLLKERETWPEELTERLHAQLAPLSSERLAVVVPAFDATRILVGGIPVELNPLAFAIVDALAFGYPSSRDQFLRLTTRYWNSATPAVPKKQAGMTAEELKIVICWREVTDLKADFMGDSHEENQRQAQLAEHQRQVRHFVAEIRTAVRDAFSHFGVDIIAEDFIRIEGSGEQQRYRLAGPAVVCDTPEQFFQQDHPFRILIVEDDPDWRARIRSVLQYLAPCELLEAGTYEEALERARTFQPDLISLDLEIPRDGVPRPENGLDLRKELTLLLGGEEASPSFLVLTAHDVPWLRQELVRLVPGPDIPPAAGPLQVVDLLRRRVNARAICLKQDDESALQQVLREAWRVLQEHRTGGGWQYDAAGPLHKLEVHVDDAWGLRIDGRDVPQKARGSNRRRDQALVKVLALYSNVFLRGQAILDYWAEHHMLGPKDVKNPRQLLKERIQFLRECIAEQLPGSGEDAKRVLAERKGGYALCGHVQCIDSITRKQSGGHWQSLK